MPTWRIRTEGVPTVRRAYGGDVQTNAGAYAPGVVVNPTEFAGGCEATYGAPRRLVMIDPEHGHGANYLPAEAQPGKWGVPAAANDMMVTLTGPRTSPSRNRPIHVPPPMATPDATASKVVEHNQGAKAKLPRPITTPTPQPRLVFAQYGG